MPRLRSLPSGFTLRNRGFRSPERSLAESSATGGLLADYELACRAGRAVMPVVRQIRLPLDYSSGRGVRIDDRGVITLIADSALQANRLRNLSKRLLERLVTEGVPVVGLEFRVRGRRSTVEAHPDAEAMRTPSLIAAAELRHSAATLKNESLRLQILALADVLEPRPEEMPLAVQAALENTARRLTALLERAARLRDLLPSAPDPRLIPEEASAAADSRLSEVRRRMRSRLARRTLAETEIGLVEETARLDRAAIAEALGDLLPPDDPAALREPPSAEALAASGRLAASAALRIAGLRHRLDAVEDRLTLPLEEAAGGPPAETAASVSDAPAAHAAGTEDDDRSPDPGALAKLSAPELRAELLRWSKVLRRRLALAQSMLMQARIRMPELPDILSADGRLAEEVGALARARESGDARAAAGALSAESSRRLLSWESRLEVSARLDALEGEMAEMLDRFEADRPWLRAPRSKYADEQPEALEALRAIDRRLQGEEERISAVSAEIETLAERVEILRADLPEAALGGLEPLEARMLEAVSHVRERLKVLEEALGQRPNAAIIPSPEEAAADPRLAEIRTRQLGRLERWDARAERFGEAKRSAEAIDRVLTAPRGDGLSPAAAGLMERAMSELRERFEAARIAIAPELPALEAGDAAQGWIAVPAAPADAPSVTLDDPGLFPELAEMPFPEEETEAAPAEPDLRKSLRVLIDFLPIWEDRLPGSPDLKLIPSEADCAADEGLAALRERMLARRARRADLEARLARLGGDARAAAAQLRNPLADEAESRAAARAVLEEADRFSADLGRRG